MPSSTSPQGNEVPAEKRLDGAGDLPPPSPPSEGGGAGEGPCSRWSCREGAACEAAALDMHMGAGGTGIGNKNQIPNKQLTETTDLKSQPEN